MVEWMKWGMVWLVVELGVLGEIGSQSDKCARENSVLWTLKDVRTSFSEK